MTSFSLYLFIFCACWGDDEVSLHHELLEFRVFLWSDESLFCLQFTMSWICRHLFYKTRAYGGYWLFVSSRWTRVFWRVFTSNSCDIRTSLTWSGRYKSTSVAECVFSPNYPKNDGSRACYIRLHLLYLTQTHQHVHTINRGNFTENGSHYSSVSGGSLASFVPLLKGWFSNHIEKNMFFLQVNKQG